MFETKIHWIDVNPHLATGSRKPPNFYLERALLHGDKPNGGVFNTAEVARVGRYLTLVTPVDQPPEWSLTVEGPVVRIPIYGYSVPLHNGPLILASGFELAFKFCENLRQHTPESIEEMHLVLHHETHTIANNAVRMYAGFSLRLKG